MTTSCDYASPADTSLVNYHFDADSMTIYPIDHPAVVSFVAGGGVIAAYITPAPPDPAPEPPRDALAELDALKAALVKKNIVTDEDVNAEVTAFEAAEASI